MFCAYPMPSLRDPLPKKVTYSPGKSLDKYLMSKEHARLSKDQLENHQSSFLQRHQRNRTESDLGFTEGSMSDTLFTTASSQKSSRTIRTLGSVVSDISRSSRIRSSSAPARALRRQSSFSDSGGKSVGELLKRENKPNDKISAQIAKWASSSLKDYFDAKEKLGLSDNNSVHSGASGVVSTNSMDYQRGRSTTPQPVRSNYSSPMQSPNKEFVSLRRLYNVNRSTAAPFALDTD